MKKEAKKLRKTFVVGTFKATKELRKEQVDPDTYSSDTDPGSVSKRNRTETLLQR